MPKRSKSNATTAQDFTKFTVQALKAECKQRNLEATGKKADLIQR